MDINHVTEFYNKLLIILIKDTELLINFSFSQVYPAYFRHNVPFYFMFSNIVQAIMTKSYVYRNTYTTLKLALCAKDMEVIGPMWKF